MTFSAVLTDYLGVGLAANRPATPAIAPTALALYLATDTGVLSAWNNGTSTWITVTTSSTTLTAMLDAAIGNTQGDILYRSGTVWTALAPGTSGQVLQTGGPGADPAWVTGSGGGRAPYTGVVATRCGVPTDIFTDSTGVGGSTMSRTYHYALDNISSLQVGYAAWVPQVANTDALPTHNCTMTGSVEYPAGVMHQLTWGGNATATVTPGQTVLSDPLAVTIPLGAKFFLRRYITGASVAYYNATTAIQNTLTLGFTSQQIADDANGDAISYGGADQTMSGTITSTDSNGFAPPCAIVATTTIPSVALIGDSITNGFRDTVQANQGLCGIMSRAISTRCGTINMGTNGDTALGFVTGTNSARRQALAQYCSHVNCEYGINDLLAGQTAAQLQANLQTIWGMFSGKPMYQTTITPNTTSTDSWATTANQTAFAASAARISVNTFIRTVPSPLAGIFDVCTTYESSLNSGLWAAPSVSVDGVHPTAAGYELISTTGVINPAVFV